VAAWTRTHRRAHAYNHRMDPRVLPLLATVLSSSLLAAPPAPSAPQRRADRIGPGVYVIQHRDALPDFPEGNTTVVVGERSVLVVDSGLLPSNARQDIAEIRRWTDRPVQTLVLTHGHTDHTSGTGTYARAWPGLRIVAHRETRTLMARYTPGYPDLWVRRTADLRRQADTGKAEDGTALSTAQLEEIRADVRAREAITEDLRGTADSPLPDVTFEQGSLSFDLGGREAQVRFLGRGNTAGDVVVWLPAERIAVVGDILVSPVPYTCSGFPVDWVRTLDAIAALQPALIVPGHGEVMHDLGYLRMVHDLVASVVEQVDAIFQRIPGGGQSSLEVARKSVKVDAFRDRIPARNQYISDFFGRSVPNCLVRNAYYQLAPR